MYATPNKLAFQIEGCGLDSFLGQAYCLPFTACPSAGPCHCGYDISPPQRLFTFITIFLHLVLYSLYLLVSISYIKSIQVNTDYTVINVKNTVINVKNIVINVNNLCGAKRGMNTW